MTCSKTSASSKLTNCSSFACKGPVMKFSPWVREAPKCPVATINRLVKATAAVLMAGLTASLSEKTYSAEESQNTPSPVHLWFCSKGELPEFSKERNIPAITVKADSKQPHNNR